MAVLKLSQIAAAGSAPALTDTVIGVGGGTTDLQYTITQIAAAFPLASSSQFGLVKVDGTTITAAAGVISAVDTDTITINTTTITGGTSGTLLYDNSATVGETSSVAIKYDGAGLYTNISGVNHTYFAYTGFRCVVNDGGAYGYSFWNADVLGGGLKTAVNSPSNGVLSFDTTSPLNGQATIQAKTTAGAPTTSDVPAGTWALIRDTVNNTTKVYYNNAGTLMSVALT